MDSSVAGRQCRVHQEHHAPHAVGRLRGDPSKSCVFDSLDFFFHFTEFEILLMIIGSFYIHVCLYMTKTF